MPSLTKHALVRMRERGVSLSEFQATLEARMYRRGDRIFCQSSQITLVLTLDGCFCVTVWRND
jgi:hypothetical protein